MTDKNSNKILDVSTKLPFDDFKSVIEESFDGILVGDAKGIVLYANEAYERNTGIKLESIVGHDIRELINPVWMKTSALLLVLEKRTSVSLEHSTQNNKRIIVTGTPIFNEDGRIRLVIVNVRDISEIYHLKQDLNSVKKTVELYREQVSSNGGIEDENGVVVVNDKMREIYRLTERICNFNATVLITGASGVGKELVARSLHDKSSLRKDEKFVTVNCGAIPENLLESELFGYEEGAFTGALKGGKVGIFEAANGGTVFLDEIGELSLNLQVKLLRVLENRKVIRLGSVKEIPLDINVVAATNKDLEKAVEKGEFREDLFYRLNVISIKIPPLKERKDEIAPLALKFVNQYNEQYGCNKKLRYEVIEELQSYDWPGNIRQLKNVIENMVVVSSGEYIELIDIPWFSISDSDINGTSENSRSLQDMLDSYEKSILRKAKEKYGTTRSIGEALEVDQSTIVRKLKKYGL